MPISYGSILLSTNYYHSLQTVVLPRSGESIPISQPLIPCKLHMLSSLGNSSHPISINPFPRLHMLITLKKGTFTFNFNSIPIPSHLNSPRNTQLANLAQHILHPRVEIATSILIARRSIEVLLHLRHAAVSFRAEAQLDFDERFESGVEIGDSVYHRNRQ
jgi:hypothetical protein